MPLSHLITARQGFSILLHSRQCKFYYTKPSAKRVHQVLFIKHKIPWIESISVYDRLAEFTKLVACHHSGITMRIKIPSIEFIFMHNHVVEMARFKYQMYIFPAPVTT